VHLEAGGFTLENPRIRARFDHRAWLVSLWDHESGRELMAAPGNRFALFKDVPSNWDAWDLDSMAESLPVPCDEGAQITLELDSPWLASVRVRRMLHQSTVEQVISLRHDSRRIDFHTTIDWQERHKLLKVAFPVDIHANEAISEIQFGHVRRPNHQSRQYDQDRFEVCSHKWTALAEEGRGAAVINDSKYGLSVKGRSINLTLLKSPMAPDMTADIGPQALSYALYSWNSSLLESGVVREAYDLNVPVQIVPGNQAEAQGSFFTLDRDNIVIETVKPAEDGTDDVILRLYESMRTAARCTLHVFRPIQSAVLTNMLEEELGPLAFDGPDLALDFRPFEIKTIRLKL